MPRYVAFLRAINVGGRNVRMAELARFFTELGFERVSTFGASGNVIFETRASGERALVDRIERGLDRALGYEVATFLRTDHDVVDLADRHLFPEAELKGAKALNVGFLARPLDEEQIEALAGLESEVDAFRVEGREIWWLCRLRQSESKFTNARFERVVGVRSTFRSVSTLQRLAARLESGP